MILTGADQIREVILFPQMRPESMDPGNADQADADAIDADPSE
jgi:aspartyl-tRNA synthetase